MNVDFYNSSNLISHKEDYIAIAGNNYSDYKDEDLNFICHAIERDIFIEMNDLRMPRASIRCKIDNNKLKIVIENSDTPLINKETKNNVLLFRFKNKNLSPRKHQLNFQGRSLLKRINEIAWSYNFEFRSLFESEISRKFDFEILFSKEVASGVGK